jgi:lipoprotein-releasing system ATP-binding protein
MNDLLLSAQKLRKTYSQGGGELSILQGVDLKVYQGDSLCIVGSSGAGKSTLLHILGTLDRPDSGELLYRDKNLNALVDKDLADFRNSTMGFVFQFHHLFSELTALENVMLPLRIAGVRKKEASATALQWLEQLGLGARSSHFPAQLSGGELQRVAIARALVRQPKILFADEPTGNLDSQNSLVIQNLFFELKERLGLTLVVVTHDPQFARRFARVLRLKDGLWAS